jgi:hypothetical protein
MTSTGVVSNAGQANLRSVFDFARRGLQSRVPRQRFPGQPAYEYGLDADVRHNGLWHPEVPESTRRRFSPQAWLFWHSFHLYGVCVASWSRTTRKCLKSSPSNRFGERTCSAVIDLRHSVASSKVWNRPAAFSWGA